MFANRNLYLSVDFELYFIWILILQGFVRSTGYRYNLIFMHLTESRVLGRDLSLKQCQRLFEGKKAEWVGAVALFKKFAANNLWQKTFFTKIIKAMWECLMRKMNSLSVWRRKCSEKTRRGESYLENNFHTHQAEPVERVDSHRSVWLFTCYILDAE